MNKIIYSALTATALITSANAAIITGVTASSSSDFNGNTTSSRTTDASGFDGTNHGTAFQQHWFSDEGATPTNQEWIQWDLGDVYNLNSVQVWNGNQTQGGVFTTTAGIQQVDIYYSASATPGDPEAGGALNWILLAENATFNQATGLTTYAGFDLATATGVALPAAGVRHLRFEVDTNYGGTTASLSEIRFDGTVAVPEPSSAALLGLGGMALLVRRRR